MVSASNESSPLMSETQKSYDGIAVKNIDEEYVHSSSSSSSSTTIENHTEDAEYLIKHRLGDTTLGMITFCLCTGAFLAAVDTSICFTIFNIIGTEFYSSNLAIWIVTSYMLSTSAIQPLYGKLSDIFGRKSTLVAIIGFFLVGSWLCGAANNMLQMSIARAIAGLGGGGIFTLASVVIHDLLPMKKRGQYQGYVNMAQTIGSTLGAPLGGFINDYIGWRYCFYINIPFCLFLLYIYIYKMENYNLEKDAKASDNIKEKLKKIDFVGAVLLLTANLLFASGASLGGNTREWSDPLIISFFVIAAVLFVSFFVFEFYFAKNPLISRTLIKNRNTMAVCVHNFFFCLSTMSFSYLVPQYFMGVLGYSPSSAGFWVLPRAIMVAAGCMIAGRYLEMKGKYKKFVVVLMMVHIFSTICIHSWKLSTPIYLQLLCTSSEGFIFGSVFVATMVALVADIPHSETASATSMIFLCRSTGWLTGSAITAAIQQASFKYELYSRMPSGPETAKIIEFVRSSITKVQALPIEVQEIVHQSLYNAIRTALLFGVLSSVISFLCSLCLRNCQLGGQKK